MNDLMLALLRKHGPMSANQLGVRLGACKLQRGRYGWGGPKVWNAFSYDLRTLREAGLAVKLPHEGARSDATYAACDDHHHASRLQLEASEALLKREKNPLRRRMLTQALVGLRAMVAADGGGQ